MWRLFYGLLPVIHPYAWLSISRMTRWSAARRRHFRRLAAVYVLLPPVLATVWYLLSGGEKDAARWAIAADIMLLAQVICLAHAAVVLLSRKPWVVKRWRLFYALLPVIQPYVWVSMSGMKRWPPARRAHFRRLAAGYFILPPLAAVVWLLLSPSLDTDLRWEVAALIMIVAYAACLAHACLAHAGMVAEPKPHRGLLLDIAVIYCSILGGLLPVIERVAVLGSALGLLATTMHRDRATHTVHFDFWAPGYSLCLAVLLFLVFPWLRRRTRRISLMREIFDRASHRVLWWVLYGAVVAFLADQLDDPDHAPELVNWAILTAILAVPPLYYVLPWTRPLRSAIPPMPTVVPV